MQSEEPIALCQAVLTRLADSLGQQVLYTLPEEDQVTKPAIERLKELAERRKSHEHGEPDLHHRLQTILEVGSKPRLICTQPSTSLTAASFHSDTRRTT
jgi:hypothetical protein